MSTKALKILLSRIAKEGAEKAVKNTQLENAANSLKVNKSQYVKDNLKIGKETKYKFANEDTKLTKKELTREYREWIKNNPKEWNKIKSMPNRWEVLQQKLTPKFGKPQWQEDFNHPPNKRPDQNIQGQLPTENNSYQFKIKGGKGDNFTFQSVVRRNSHAGRSGVSDVNTENTTLDSLQFKTHGKLNPEEGPLHHAASRGVISKMHAQYEKNLNKNWKPSDGPSKEGKNFLRVLRNKFGIDSGHDIGNIRSYPPDSIKNKKVSQVHNTAHKLAHQLKINPEQSFKNYTNQDLMKFAKYKLGPSIKKIDETLGYKPLFTKPGQSGAAVRGLYDIKYSQPSRAVENFKLNRTPSTMSLDTPN